MADMFDDDLVRGEAAGLHLRMCLGPRAMGKCVGSVGWESRVASPHQGAKSLRIAVDGQLSRIYGQSQHPGPYQDNFSFPAHWVEIRAKIRCMSGGLIWSVVPKWKSGLCPLSATWSTVSCQPVLSG